jgi:hypothetical protein
MLESAVLVPSSESQVFVRVCCHCRRVRSAAGWQRTDEAPQAIITHGICRDCFVALYPAFPLPDELP